MREGEFVLSSNCSFFCSLRCLFYVSCMCCLVLWAFVNNVFDPSFYPSKKKKKRKRRKKKKKGSKETARECLLPFSSCHCHAKGSQVAGLQKEAGGGRHLDEFFYVLSCYVI